MEWTWLRRGIKRLTHNRIVLILAVYFIHPCMRRRKFAKARGASVGGLANTGMMVLPVMQPGGKKKKGKKGRGKPCRIYDNA